MTDERLNQFHICPWCPGQDARCLEAVERDADLDMDFGVLTCAVHGKQHHDLDLDDFCWCAK